MANNVGYVSVGKPGTNGAVYRAPYGTTLPTSISDTLDSAFASLGYISDDGMTNENSPETDQIKAWGGEVVAIIQSEKADTFKYKLIEGLNVDVLKTVYGDDNVTGALATGITVRANAKIPESSSYVIDTIMGANAKRIVIPNGQVSEVGEIVYKDDEVVGYEVTITALPDESIDYDTHREYIIATGPTGATGATGATGSTGA